MNKLTYFAGLLETENVLPKPIADQNRIDTVAGIVFGLLGAVAVLVIVLGGLKYITSKGDPGEMAKAKNTIIYALIGLGVVIMSYAIVAFVIANI